jgi:orotate phosphoribosyltransferase
VTESEVLDIFRETGALLEGHFLLRSGVHSRQDFQCALVLQHPRHAKRRCGALAAKLGDNGVETVVSPATGGLFVGYELARALNLRHVFVKKNAAGKLELRRNFQIAGKVIAAEDVVTRGARVEETIENVRKNGGRGRGGRGDRGPFGREAEFWRAVRKFGKMAHRNI